MNERYTARLGSLQKAIAQNEIEAALITKRENIRYICGFTGTQACLAVTGNRCILITDSRYTEQAREEAYGCEIQESEISMEDTICQVITDINPGNIGFEDSTMPYGRYDKLKNTLGREMKPMGLLIEALRMIKDQWEIGLIRKAVQIADKAFLHILHLIKPGVAERDIAAELEYYLKKNGAQGEAFETIIASGYRSSLPHGVASGKVIEKGEAVIMDFGAVFEGYCSDMTRTVFVGKPDAEMKKVYNTVLRAQTDALEAAAEGLSGREIDSIARTFITREGYGNYFGHALGHGVGLEVHEQPRLSVSGDTVMKNGMTVTIEPGIYLPGKGGVRIEDLVVIQGAKPEILTGSEKKMLIL